MKLLTFIFIGMALLAAFATLCAISLWFMIRRPVQWASFSDRLDDFWVRKGIMSHSFAAKCKRFERGGFGKKLVIGLVVAALIENAGGFLFIAYLIIRSGGLLHR